MRLLAVILALGVSMPAIFGADNTMLPSRDPGVVLPRLRLLQGRPEIRDVEKILGAHDREVGSGRCIFVYVLRDKSAIWANTGDCTHLGSITLRRSDKPDETLFEVKQEPNQLPEPTSPSVTPAAGAAGAPSVAVAH